MERKVAVVTGAAQGLGWAVAEALAKDSFEVLMIDKSADVTDKANALVKQGFVASAVLADLTKLDLIPSLVADVLTRTGRCDVLVNNAGLHSKTNGRRFNFDEVPRDVWELSLALHMTAPFLLSQGFLHGMKERRWGRVINVSSRGGRTYTHQAGVQYSAAKAGIIGLTRSIAGEYGSFGVTANTIAPGRFNTSMANSSSAEIKAAALTELPVGRLGDPKEIGAVVSFLASNNAGFITGAVIDVNGGGFMP